MTFEQFMLGLQQPVFSPAGEDGDGDGDGDKGNDDGGESIMDKATDKQDGDDNDGDKGDNSDDNDGDSGPYRPDGLPDHLYGESDKETLDSLAKAYKGARDQIANRKTDSDGKVPDNIDGYKIEAKGDDDTIAAELNSKESQPIMDAFKTAALEVGMGEKQFSTFIRKGTELAAEAGIPIGISPEKQSEISANAEFADLAEMTGGEKTAQAMVDFNRGIFDKSIENGTATEDDRDEFNEMVGTAQSTALFQRMMAPYVGEMPIPLTNNADAGVTPGDAEAAHAAALSMKPGAERDNAIKKAEKMFETAYGTAPANSVITAL